MDKVLTLPNTANPAQIAVEDALFLQVVAILQVIEEAAVETRIRSEDDAAVFASVRYYGERDRVGDTYTHHIAHSTAASMMSDGKTHVYYVYTHRHAMTFRFNLEVERMRVGELQFFFVPL